MQRFVVQVIVEQFVSGGLELLHSLDSSLDISHFRNVRGIRVLPNQLRGQKTNQSVVEKHWLVKSMAHNLESLVSSLQTPHSLYQVHKQLLHLSGQC